MCVKTINAVSAMHVHLFNNRSAVAIVRVRCDSFQGKKHQAKIRQANTGMSIRWPRFCARADCTLHVLLLASPAFCCCSGMKEIEQLY